MLENTVAQYQIQIQRTGDGAELAVESFKKLDLSAQALDKSLATSSASLVKAFAEMDKGAKALPASLGNTTAELSALRNSSFLATNAMRDLAAISALTGGQRLGELAYAGTAAAASMRVLRSAALATGIELGVLAPIIGGIAAVAGVGFSAWNDYKQSLKATEDQAKATAKALEEMPGLVEHILALQRTGIVSSSQAAGWLDQLGRSPLIGSLGNTLEFSAPAQFANDPGLPRPGQAAGALAPSNITSVKESLRAAGIMDANQVFNPEIEALQKLRTLQQAFNTDVMDGFAKQRAEAQKNYDAQIAQINSLAAIAGSKIAPGEKDKALSSADAILQSKLALINQAEVAKVTAEQSKLQLRQIEDEVTAFTLSSSATRSGAALQEYRIRTAGLEKMRFDGLLTEMDYNERILEAERKLHQGQTAEDRRFQLERNQETEEMVKQFDQEQKIQALSSKADRVSIARDEYNAKIQFYELLFEEDRITQDKLTDLEQRALIEKLSALKSFENKYKLHILTLQEMEAHAAETFSSGLGQAIVDFAAGTKSAEQAFKEFAVSFLEQIAKMIIQTEILAAIKAIAGLGDGGTVTKNAGGGVHFAANGIMSVSSPTYFPKFNVIAGEAGTEMLTVLARPRYMELGGIEAVVGNAGPNKLAITNASDLANGGAKGGHMVIEIRHSEDAKAKIIQDAIQGAEIRVTQNLQRNTPLRAAMKKATT